jgi:hypothetical protein
MRPRCQVISSERVLRFFTAVKPVYYLHCAISQRSGIFTCSFIPSLEQCQHGPKKGDPFYNNDDRKMPHLQAVFTSSVT